MKNICTVTVYDKERKKEWEEVFGTNIVPAISLFASKGNFPGIGVQDYYELDLDRLIISQKVRLVKHISKKFGIPVLKVKREIEKVGVPILAKDCIISDEIRKYL